MTTYYLSSVDGSNASDGLSWDNAFATFEYAVETASAAASGPHILYVDSAHSETLNAADITVTAAGDIRIICVNRSGSDAPTTGAVVETAGYSLLINGAFEVYIYGMTFRVSGTAAEDLALGNTDGAHFELENCRLEMTQTTSNRRIYLAHSATNSNSYLKATSCVFKFGATTQGIIVRGVSDLIGCSVDSAGSACSTLFFYADSQTIAHLDGCDFSHITGTLCANSTVCTPEITFRNCKLGSGVTPLAAAVTVLNKGNASVTLYNCNAGDAHYSFYHGDAFGSTTAVTTYYADDGATTASTNLSYKVVTTANCSYYTPYVGPWIAKAQTTTGSSVTPSFEGLRVDSTTIIQDDEVWGEWSYQGTSGFPLAVFVNDRKALDDATPNDQTSTKAYSDWTGSPTDTDAADSTFKLVPSAITPAETGFIMGRVVVGEPSLTVYYDPQIRVA